jgi:hypothetical protein
MDDLLRARMTLGAVSAKDSEAALAVLDEWTDQQAVANVLFYPDMLPRQQGARFLLKALNETDFPYYTLAAIVGLQSVEQDELGQQPGTREEIKDRLFALIDRADEVMRGWETDEGVRTLDEVIGDRASALLPTFAERADARRLAAWLGHAAECVRNNAYYTLVELVGDEEARRVADEALASGKVSTLSQIVPGNIDEPFILWAYIPNLTQLYPADQLRQRH